MDLIALERQTREIYNRNAQAFDNQRPKRLHEKKWLDRFTGHIAPGGHILDVGCGAGEPFTTYFLEHGFQVTGTDFSEQMLTIAQQRFPSCEWIRADMRSLDIGLFFDGIIGWNSFFHLSQADQRATLPLLATHLNPGGILMLTVGPDAGEVTGHVNGELVYHASLSPTEYVSCLEQADMELLEFVPEDEECDMQTVLLARKKHLSSD